MKRNNFTKNDWLEGKCALKIDFSLEKHFISLLNESKLFDDSIMVDEGKTGELHTIYLDGVLVKDYSLQEIRDRLSKLTK